MIPLQLHTPRFGSGGRHEAEPQHEPAQKGGPTEQGQAHRGQRHGGPDTIGGLEPEGSSSTVRNSVSIASAE